MIARAFGLLVLVAASIAWGQGPAARNVVIIMTDDQGYGDLGCKGNPVLRTPNIDQLAAESGEMRHFYVSPVCAPTRAALMTGRHTQRTHAIDTWIGRAMLEPEEVTLAEMLGGAGFATGIFGKWHLGDCVPMTPNDQGFEHALVHRGGGIGQPADPIGGKGKYTDPVLFENGERRELEGYCTDIYFERAIEWMGEQQEAGRRFFAYIPTNAPHGPFNDVPRALYEYYKAQDLSPGAFGAGMFAEGEGYPLPEKWDEDRLARIFAMIENIDQNVGRLVGALEGMGILDETMIVYLHDNGPNTQRYTAGLRGMKSNVYEGGVRTPLFVRLPGVIPFGRVSDVLAAHYDIAPTVLEACGVAAPAGVAFDGRSFLPLLRGEEGVEWPERYVVLQAHRGDWPVRYHNMMIRDSRWKLVNASGFGREVTEVEPAFELFDLDADPFERHDLAAAEPATADRLRAAYNAWFEDVGASDRSNYGPIPIEIGGERSGRVVLTHQDWVLPEGSRGWGNNGTWLVRVVDEGPYRVRILEREQFGGDVAVRVGGRVFDGFVENGSRVAELRGVRLPAGVAELTTSLVRGGETVGAYQVEIVRE